MEIQAGSHNRVPGRFSQWTSKPVDTMAINGGRPKGDHFTHWKSKPLHTTDIPCGLIRHAQVSETVWAAKTGRDPSEEKRLWPMCAKRGCVLMCRTQRPQSVINRAGLPSSKRGSAPVYETGQGPSFAKQVGPDGMGPLCPKPGGPLVAEAGRGPCFQYKIAPLCPKQGRAHVSATGPHIGDESTAPHLCFL